MNNEGKDDSKLAGILSLIGALLVFLPLGARALWDPDEGRYAEIGREMLALKDWIVPHLNYLPYLEKPPLGYWLIASSLSVFGHSEWAARLPCALAGLATAAIVWRLARSSSESRMAWLPAGILLSSLEFYLFTQFLVLDMMFTLFVTTSLWLFWKGYQSGRHGKAWLGAGLAAGAATLVKGPAGLVLPGLVITIFLFSEKKGKLLFSPSALAGLGAALLVPIPWLILMTQRVPGFLSFFFLHEQAGRFLTQMHGRDGPILYYVPVILIGFLPWSFLIPVWIKDLWNRRKSGIGPAERFLLIWFGTIFIFFSLAGSKLVTYILPAFPALALLVGLVLNQKPERWGLLWGILITNLIAMGLLVSLARIHFPGISETLLPSLKPLLAVLALTPVGIGLFLAINRRKEALATLILGGLLFGTCALFPTHLIEPYMTTRPLAQEIARQIKPEDVVLSYDANYQETRRPVASSAGAAFSWADLEAQLSATWTNLTGISGLWNKPLEGNISSRDIRSYAPTYDRRLQSLPFYLERRIIVAGALGELLPGAQLDPDKNFLLDEKGFTELLRSKQVYGICRTIHLPEVRQRGPVEVLATQADLSLFKNQH